MDKENTGYTWYHPAPKDKGHRNKRAHPFVARARNH